MLAPNYLSAKELGLKKHDRDALISVLGALERDDDTVADFDMGTWCGCIYGQAQKLGAFASSMIARKESFETALWDLFTHTDAHADPRNKQRAAVALRTYLVTGKADWRH